MTDSIQTLDAVLIDTELRQIAGEVQAYKWRAADLVIAMEACAGWKAVGYKTKTAWLKSFQKQSRSTLYEAAKIRKQLPGFTAETLDGLTQENLKYLKLLPESRRADPEVMEQARKPEQEFVAYLNENHHLHITAPKKLVVEFEDAGQYEEVSQAIKAYCQQEGVTRSQAIWEMLQQ